MSITNTIGERGPLITETPRKRRVSIVIERDGSVLLARDEGRKEFMLPGGGIEAGESHREAAVRELAEETGMIGSGFSHIFTHFSATTEHNVMSPASVTGIARPAQEVEELLWWDGVRRISTTSSVMPILSDLRIGFLPPR